MHLDSLQLWLLIGGLVFSIFGGIAVFSETFREMWWSKEHESELDKKLFPGKSGYYFNRYGRGLGSLTLGIMMTAAFFGSLWKPLLPVLAVIAAPGNLLSTGYGKAFVLLFALFAVYMLLRSSLRHSESEQSDTKQ